MQTIEIPISRRRAKQLKWADLLFSESHALVPPEKLNVQGASLLLSCVFPRRKLAHAPAPDRQTPSERSFSRRGSAVYDL